MARGGELVGHVVEDRPADSRGLYGGGDIRTGQRSSDHWFDRTLAIGNSFGEGEGENAFAARGGRHPMIRVRRGQVLPGRNGDQSCAAIRMLRQITVPRQLTCVLGSGGPRVDEVGAEVDDQVGTRDVEDRSRRDTEDLLARFDECMLPERLIAQAARDARRRDELIEKTVERGTDRTSENPRLARRTADLRRQLVLRVVPIGRLERAVAVARRGPLDSVGMVGAAQPGLATSAKSALVHRMLGVALEFDRPALARLHVEPASCGALLARGRVVDCDPRRDLLGLDHIGDQLVRGFTSHSGCGTRGEANDFQKVATIELGHADS